MNLELLLSDVSEIKQENFKYSIPYTNKQKSDLEKRYGLSTNQLNSLICPNSRVTFDNGAMIDTPRPGAKLPTVIKHIRRIIKRKEWLNDRFNNIVKIC
jgi:hypothetical protein